MKIRESFSARRLVCLTGIAFAGMGADVAMASSSVSVGTSGFDGSSRVSFSAASGETNNVSFSRLSSSAVRVNDFTTPLDPIAPCVAVDANNVDCPIESDKPWIVNAYLLDMNDTLAFNPPADGELQAGEGAADRTFVNGGPGNDTFEGTSGPDTLDGEAGNDSLSGLGGTDDLIGGADNDTIQAYDSRIDSVINCGDGLDALTDTEIGEQVWAEMAGAASRREPVGNAGYELTLTLPKSFSMYALSGPEQLSGEWLDVMEAAATSALERLMAEAGFCSTGHRGDGQEVQVMPADGWAG